MTKPTVADFKAYFYRDFPYAADNTDLTKVTSQDIERAMVDAEMHFNDELFSTNEAVNVGFMLLSAHHLVENLRASSQGINGQYSWLTSSKGVGSVSESLQIPEQIAQNPYMAMLSKTTYGAKFLQHVLPKLSGQIFTMYSDTNA